MNGRDAKGNGITFEQHPGNGVTAPSMEEFPAYDATENAMLQYNGPMSNYKEIMTKKDVKRFESKFQKTDGCWLWRGSLVVNGYGRMRPHGKANHVNAHRISYELYVGRIPEGLTLDHLCRVRACVNPSHLEPVTKSVNTLRGYGAAAKNARKIQCNRGHKYTSKNTYLRSSGHRICRRCYEIRTGSKLCAPGWPTIQRRRKK